MKMMIILSAFAVFALGAVVGRASVSVPAAPPTAAKAFSPTSMTISPNLPIENFAAI